MGGISCWLLMRTDQLYVGQLGGDGKFGQYSYVGTRSDFSRGLS